MPTDYRHTDRHLRLVMTHLFGLETRGNYSLPHSAKLIPYRESTNKWTDGWMDRQRDGCFQVYYVPALLSYAVDKNVKQEKGKFRHHCSIGPMSNRVLGHVFDGV